MAQHELISIPASHFCERARWALDYAGIPFVEHKWPPMLHLCGTLPTSRTRTVPMLKCPASTTRKSRVLTDSLDIVRYANERLLEASPAPPAPAPGTDSSSGRPPNPTVLPLYPSDPDQLREVERLEALFGRKLGVWTRVVAYQQLFSDRRAALDVLALRQPALAGWKCAVLRGTYGLVRGAICKGLGVDERREAVCLERIRNTFGEVDELLQRGGGEYLVGGRFTAADLTFASMAAVVLIPEQYGAYLPPLDSWPPEFPGRQLRDTPAGRHALRMYELHRRGNGGGGQPTAGAGDAAGAEAALPATRARI